MGNGGFLISIGGKMAEVSYWPVSVTEITPSDAFVICCCIEKSRIDPHPATWSLVLCQTHFQIKVLRDQYNVNTNKCAIVF
jgi:hypothetical protein